MIITKIVSFGLLVNGGGKYCSDQDMETLLIDCGDEFPLVTFAIQNIQAHELICGLWLIYEHYLNVLECTPNLCCHFLASSLFAIPALVGKAVLPNNYSAVRGIGWGGR